jgi:hypothetical protein
VAHVAVLGAIIQLHGFEDLSVVEKELDLGDAAAFERVDRV